MGRSMEASHVEWVPPDSFDDYRLVQVLGRGSMGQVWLAHDTVLDRLVAVKFIATLPGHRTARHRFLTEARAAARIQHPNIITIYRVGEIGPRPYLISEYVRGVSLDRIAKPVATPRLLAIAIGLSRGLAAAHRHGVLHRDLKPANAIVSESGDVKLLDFGLAKLLEHVAPFPVHGSAAPRATATQVDRPGEPTVVPAPPSEPSATAHDTQDAQDTQDTQDAQDIQDAQTIDGNDAPGSKPHTGVALPAVTSTGAVMGTPAYMPPEAWRGEPATPRSDVYSLGALLYELAQGRPPHRADSPEATRRSVLDRDAPSLAVTVPKAPGTAAIDPRFAAVIDRCLRRDPADRFASGEAVCEALEALAAGDLAAANVPAQSWRPRPRARQMGLAAVAAALALALLAYNLFNPAHTRHPGARAASGTCPEGMVRVPAGTFVMGSPEGAGEPDEHPQHEVTLSAYCIDKTEVTVAAYGACVAAGACSAATQTVHRATYSEENTTRFSRLWCNGQDRPDHPINCVDWDQAAAFCRWKAKRLPTEAEWEYAARGNDGRAYPWGNEAPGATRMNGCGSECLAMSKREAIVWQAIYDGDDGWETTAPVGSYPEGASPFGALDMLGNVWEWTNDWYGDYAKRAETNPQGAGTGTSRVSRGGSWAGGTRLTDRYWLDPTVREGNLGLRCALGD